MMDDENQKREKKEHALFHRDEHTMKNTEATQREKPLAKFFFLLVVASIIIVVLMGSGCTTIGEGGKETTFTKLNYLISIFSL